MTIAINTPTFPESISEGTIAAWHKSVGDMVRRDELLVEVETDKVVLEIVAPADGKLVEILKAEGDTVESEELLGRFEEAEVGAGANAPVVEAAQGAASTPVGGVGEEGAATSGQGAQAGASPSARKLAEENGIDVAAIAGTGRGGLVIKEDVARAVSDKQAAPPAAATPPATPPASPPVAASAPEMPAPLAEEVDGGERVERRVPMTRLRASIARRLVEAQHNAAMLTTFNEVNMEPVMTMRKRYGETFQRSHNGTKLGFMSFFVRAAAEALKRFPSVNASIDGNDILYHGYYDIGVAVGTERGLVVPVIRDVDALGFHQIEDAVNDFATRARANKLTIEDMSGGTFTITNGGIYGSMMSTPILNPPQTAILGMHKIQDRAMVENGEVVVLPMMYLALSYDHRLIDGQEAVRFLVTIKELIEDPARILLEL